jgi:polysaccharide biosynthesis/export protein
MRLSQHDTNMDVSLTISKLRSSSIYILNLLKFQTRIWLAQVYATSLSDPRFVLRGINCMNTLTKRRWKISGSLILVAALAGCAGFSASRQTNGNKLDESESGGSTTATTPITSALVKAQQAQREHQVGQDLKRLLGAPATYVIDPGDILSIVVWDHPELGGAVMATQATGISGIDPVATTSPPAGFVVDHQGMIQFPYAGKLKCSGLTEEQARSLLATALSRYINKPNVTLRVQAYRSKRIYIDGEVKVPGLQAINDIPMTLVEALNRAGGLLPTGDQSQIVVNRGGTNYYVNLLQLVQKGINPSNIILLNGDVIRVLSRDESKVFVSGEVITPRALTMHNGRLSLNEALGESGGINPITGDGRQVYVVRKSAKEPIVYQLDASVHGALAMAEGFELNPKDVVYVAASPLANWNRAISLIFPGALSSAVGAAK